MYGPITAGNLGNAWLAAASFERDRLARIKAPANQTGVSPQVRNLAIEFCEKDIKAHEERATACFKFALGEEAHAVAAGYEFSQIEGAA
jgi:hypothetical protein